MLQVLYLVLVGAVEMPVYQLAHDLAWIEMPILVHSFLLPLFLVLQLHSRTRLVIVLDLNKGAYVLV